MDFELHLLERITNHFSEENKIGSGGYGDVYRAEHEGKEIAVKRLRPLEGLDDKEFENEFLNVSKVHHKNVVELLGFCHESKTSYVEHDGKKFFATKKERIFCFEYMHGGTLHVHITDDSCDLDWPACYKIIKGTCEGLNHLHTAYNKPILHLDIKPANILLDKNNNAKISDLGLSRSATRTLVTKNIKGTPGYMPPEFRNNYCITDKNDVFGLGVLIIQLMDGKNGLTHSAEASSANQFIEHVHRKWNKRLKNMSGQPLHEMESLQVKKCVDIALRCVQHDRHKRPSTKEVVDELKQLEGIIKKLSVASHDVSKDAIVQSSSSLTYSRNKFSSLALSDQLPSSNSGMGQLDVVIVYAFDCSDWTSAWYTVDDGVFWIVQEKLTHYQGSRLGYIYPMVVNGNSCTSDMKSVDPEEIKANGYTAFARRRVTCTKNMAMGLDEAHKMISNRGYQSNGVILLFSDGLINKGDFFDGAEEFNSKVPVHVFTLGGVEYNKGLHAIAKNSPDGKFHTTPVPERPMLSARFSLLLDSIFDGSTLEDEESPSPSSETQPLDVVMVYAFDCTESTADWDRVDGMIFWMVQEKLTRLEDSCMGYIYPMLSKNNYTSDMKIVDSEETKATGYTGFARRRINCTKNMASGLAEATKMLRNRGHQNGIILFFSDGLTNEGDFFDGTENFKSGFPVHTFTLGGDTYNQGLQAIANNSPGGKFHRTPVPDRPRLSRSFSDLLDSLLGTKTD